MYISLTFINTCIFSFWATILIAYFIWLTKWTIQQSEPPLKQAIYWLLILLVLVFATSLYVVWYDEFILKNGTDVTISLLQ